MDISEWLKFGGKLALKLSISQGGVLNRLRNVDFPFPGKDVQSVG
jgi:hypothetical protein